VFPHNCRTGKEGEGGEGWRRRGKDLEKYGESINVASEALTFEDFVSRERERARRERESESEREREREKSISM
jgi:hypothetical protein